MARGYYLPGNPYIIAQQGVYDTKKYNRSTYIVMAQIMHQTSVEYFGRCHKGPSKLLKTTSFVIMIHVTIENISQATCTCLHQYKLS